MAHSYSRRCEHFPLLAFHLNLLCSPMLGAHALALRAANGVPNIDIHQYTPSKNNMTTGQQNTA